MGKTPRVSEGRVIRSITGLRPSMGIMVLILASAAVLPMAFIVLGASGVSQPTGPLTIKSIPLTGALVDEWIRAAGALSQLRDEGEIDIPVNCLPTFIEWGRNHPEILDSGMQWTDAVDFLGVTLAINRARQNFREQVEYELRVEEGKHLTGKMKEFAEQFQIPNAPLLRDRERNDLNTYEQYVASIESVLEDLLPGLPPLVPAWLEDTSPFPLEKTDGITGSAARNIAWRIVNRSRHGPSVIRVK